MRLTTTAFLRWTLAVLAITLAFVPLACQKEGLDISLLYGGSRGVRTWALADITPGPFGNGPESCNADDFLIFARNATGQFDNGPLICQEGEIKTLDFNWTADPGAQRITLIYAADGRRELWSITKLETSRLEISRTGLPSDVRVYNAR
jgi:hypothetical protein